MSVKTATVVGAGIMGRNIAQSLATAGYEVQLHDIDERQLREAVHLIENGRFGLRRGAERGKLTAEQAGSALARITSTTDLGEACSGTDLVCEAVPEDLALKMRVFRELDSLCPASAVLTSNTGGLSITALAHVTERPEKVLGWHWAQPVAVMPFAEIIIHEETSQDSTDTVVQIAKRCGKNPVVVQDQPRHWGFVVNRINAVILHEAAQIVSEGVATEDQVDTLMKDCLRWPMGPFEMQEHAQHGFEE